MAQNVSVKIKGETPLLVDKYIAKSTRPQPRMKSRPIDIPVEDMLYKNGNGYFLPSRNLLFCLRDGGKRVIERGRTTYAKTIMGGVAVEPLEITLQPQEYETYIRAVKRSNGERIEKTSPQFNNWSLEFRLIVSDWLSIDDVKRVLEVAGQMDGLGAFRIGGFGRFTVEKFEAVS